MTVLIIGVCLFIAGLFADDFFADLPWIWRMRWNFRVSAKYSPGLVMGCVGMILVGWSLGEMSIRWLAS